MRLKLNIITIQKKTFTVWPTINKLLLINITGDIIINTITSYYGNTTYKLSLKHSNHFKILFLVYFRFKLTYLIIYVIYFNDNLE